MLDAFQTQAEHYYFYTSDPDEIVEYLLGRFEVEPIAASEVANKLSQNPETHTIQEIESMLLESEVSFLVRGLSNSGQVEFGVSDDCSEWTVWISDK